MKDILTTHEAAKLLGVAIMTIVNNCKNGKIDCFFTPGGHRRINRSEIDKILKGGIKNE